MGDTDPIASKLDDFMEKLTSHQQVFMEQITSCQQGLEGQIAEISRTVQDARRRPLPTVDNPTSVEARRARDDLEAVQRPLSYPLWPASKQQPSGRASISEADRLRLVEDLCIDIELQKPVNLGIAMNMAMALERKQCFHRGGRSLRTNWGGITSKFNPSSGGPPVAKTKAMGDNNKGTPPTSFFKRLSRAEMAEQRAKGLCFNCDESYSTGHKCKRLFWIEVPDDDSEGEEEGETHPEISLHAISRVRNSQTMQLLAVSHRIPVSVLVDSGSTHNFVREGLVPDLKVEIQIDRA
ncbi:hypothetical protein ZIOFF_058914 [Zingiber officinale]|uniref:Uncharacterized protein n=1 Tax=Zingiber officinale TaxID=94328 RepID=A0A8J5KMA6_ZINOF|nr:hypothetical protein ZIOFF_058914 [Zingiber officinale]